jgi:type II secretory pathway predicted ATPase ExeA
MQTTLWGPRETISRGFNRTRCFFASSTHDEALARLGFLVDSGHSLGIVSGYQGSGRTTLLDVFAEQVRRCGYVTCRASLVGLDERALLWTLAAGLGTNPKSSDDPFLLWYQIRDQLQQFALQDRATVLLLDDADQASHEVLVQLLRLLKTRDQRLTIILAIETSRITRLGGDLLQLSQLRIRLEPWTNDDVCQFLEKVRAEVGENHPQFDDSAAGRLRELTDGIPRWVSQLTEMALLAAAAQQRETIDGPMIEAVYRELSASFEEDSVGPSY